MQTANPNVPMPVEIPPNISKALEQVGQGLSRLYMEVHQNDPESPLGEAVLELQRNAAELARTINEPSAQSDAPQIADPMAGMAPGVESADPGAMSDPMAGAAGPMPPEMAGIDPTAGGPMPPDMGGELPPGATLEDAAGATHEIMQNAAARRLGQGV